VFLFLNFLFHNLDLKIGMPLFLSWLKNLVDLVIFMHVIFVHKKNKKRMQIWICCWLLNKKIVLVKLGSMEFEGDTRHLFSHG